MSWFTNLFSTGVSEVVSAVGGVIDDLHTSDEEKMLIQQAVAKELQSFELKVMAEANKFESEVTARHSNDMKTDSWLSKNIRPLTLAITGATIYLLVWTTVFSDLSNTQIGVLEAWIPMLTGLFSTMVVFYFGSRGLEKVAKMKGNQPPA